MLRIPQGSQNRAEWGGERGGERGEREGEEPGHPRPFPASLAPKVHPFPSIELQQLPVATLTARGGGGGTGASRPYREREVSFLALVPSTPTRVPPSQPSAHFPLLPETWWWPSLVPRHRSRRSSLPQGITEGTAVKAPGERPFQFLAFRAQPVCKWRPSELPPTDSRPKRARSPLGVSPLASSSFCARWGGGL